MADYKQAKKIEYHGIKFDSRLELKFYQHYLERFGDRVLIHPSYVVRDNYTLGGYTCRKRSYSPDFVVLDDKGQITHVYDVKASITPRRGKNGVVRAKVHIDGSMKKSIDDFQRRYNWPVEIVCPYAHNYRMTIICTTKSIGIFEFTNVDYDVREIIGR